MQLGIFPATDVHLLDGTTVKLTPRARWPRWRDLSRFAGFAATYDPTPAFVSVSNNSITATAAGTAVTRMTISWNDAQGTLIERAKFPLRVSVHRELRELFVARSALEIENGVTNRLLTVYGRFEAADGSLITADITGHPYLEYSVTATSGSPSVHIAPHSGRVMAVTSSAGPGTVEIEVSVDPALNQPAASVKIDVTVVPEVTERPILNRFHTGAAIRKKSILFVPDGFTSSQQTEFEDLAEDVGRRLLDALSPYHHLRESFDLYSAFVASAEEGVSIGPPILVRPGATDTGFSLPMDQPLQQGAWLLRDLLFRLGHPSTSAVSTIEAARAQLGIGETELPQALFDLWRSLVTWPPQARVRETFFGLMIGDRYHGPEALLEPIPIPPPPDWPPSVEASIHLERGGVRVPMFDERRLQELVVDPKLAQAMVLEQFLKTLRVPGETTNHGLVWVRPSGLGDGDSHGLVVIIARADHYAGVSVEGCVLVSIGPGIVHNISASAAVPGLLEVTPVPRPVSESDEQRGFGERPLDSIVDLVAHELAHTTALGSLHDEYHEPSVTSGPALDNQDEVDFIEARPNVQLLANAESPTGPGLDPAMVKWNWERAEGAARVETIGVAGADLEIGINTEDSTRWPNLAVSRRLTLRAGNLAAPAPGSPHVGAVVAPGAPETLEFVSFDRATQLIRCKVTGSTTLTQIIASFPPGSVLVAPKLSPTGRVLRLVPELLERELEHNGPFSPSVDLGTTPPTCRAMNPINRRVSGMSWPRNQIEAIAAYESGGSYPCGVIRPTGTCKMRRVVALTEPPVEFCHVCKYAMVSVLDPALLGAIDGEYP